MEILGVKFAPLNVPLNRRLETLSAALWILIFAFGNFAGYILTAYFLFFTQTMRYFILLYFVWMYYDWNNFDVGEIRRSWKQFRNLDTATINETFATIHRKGDSSDRRWSGRSIRINPLVPVCSFGETDIYDQLTWPEGSYMKRLQEFIRKKIGIAPILLVGRGFFQYTFGLIPRRKPITVVVGSPMELPKIEEPTREQVEEYHEKFVKHLVNFFESEKHKYIEKADSVHLEFV